MCVDSAREGAALGLQGIWPVSYSEPRCSGAAMAGAFGSDTLKMAYDCNGTPRNERVSDPIKRTFLLRGVA